MAKGAACGARPALETSITRSGQCGRLAAGTTVPGMTAPTNDQVRHFAIDLAAAAATEMVLARIARRLKNGPSRPHRRFIRRAAGAVLSELVAEGLADLYWQRRRLRAEVDRRIVEARVGAGHAALPVIPSQRRARADERETDVKGLTVS